MRVESKKKKEKKKKKKEKMKNLENHFRQFKVAGALR